MSAIVQWARTHLRSIRRSASRFARPAAFSFPRNTSAAVPRLRRNLSSFRVYYFVVLWVLLLLSLFLRRHSAAVVFLMASSKIALLYEVLLKAVPPSWALLRRLLDRRIVVGVFLTVVLAELVVTRSLDCLAIAIGIGGIIVSLHAVFRSEDLEDGGGADGAGEKEKEVDQEEGPAR